VRATQSVWQRIQESEKAVSTWVDLSGLEPGTYNLPVRASINSNFDPSRIVEVRPDTVTMTLERLVSQEFPVRLEVIGEPARGYQRGVPVRSPEFVTVSGREPLVGQVVEVRANLDISQSRDDIQTRVELVAHDANSDPVEGVTITPGEVTISIPITLQEAYRTLAVRPVTTGNVANGYRITNITVSPPSVLVFSSNPDLVKDLPGFVETAPLDISGAEDDIETFVELDLPAAVSVVDDTTVLVQVFIATIDGSVRVPVPVTPIGLIPGEAAEISPENVDVILSGPVPLLNQIQTSNIRVVADVTGLDPGTHQVELAVEVVLERVQVESILPAVVEVTIGPAPTPLPTGAFTPLDTPQP
jgi:YbbR domain-containing protein